MFCFRKDGNGETKKGIERYGYFTENKNENCEDSWFHSSHVRVRDIDNQRREKKEAHCLWDVVLEAYAEDPLDGKAYKHVSMEATRRLARAGVQDL